MIAHKPLTLLENNKTQQQKSTFQLKVTWSVLPDNFTDFSEFPSRSPFFPPRCHLGTRGFWSHMPVLGRSHMFCHLSTRRRSLSHAPWLLGARPWYSLRDSERCQVFFSFILAPATEPGHYHCSWLSSPYSETSLYCHQDYSRTPVPSAILCDFIEHTELVDLLQESRGHGRQEALTQTLLSQNHTKPSFLCHCSCPWLVCDVSRKVRMKSRTHVCASFSFLFLPEN